MMVGGKLYLFPALPPPLPILIKFYKSALGFQLPEILYLEHRWAQIIFGGKLRNPYFCHIFGMERPFILLKKGMYQPGLGF